MSKIVKTFLQKKQKEYVVPLCCVLKAAG